MWKLAIAVAAAWSVSAQASPVSPASSSFSSSDLGALALEKVLRDASPIFGDYQNQTDKGVWMKNHSDNTLIVHMNLPGTHDSATWNLTQATQDALKGITEGINEVTLPPPENHRCQDRSLIDMLNAGIRVFDLRYALDATNTSLVFYHSQDLLSETATVEDVLFGFYQWLDNHPSEAIFLSFQHEGSTKRYAPNDATVQLKLFSVLTSDSAKKYFVQRKDELGTLGEARGKITLLRRFDLDQLPASYTEALPGLHLSPSQWINNSPDITLVYNQQKNLTAYIEDYYNIGTPMGSSAAENIQWKYNATTAHLIKATTEHPDSLFWSFASGENVGNVPDITPEILALGNGTEYTPQGGVNQRLLTFLKQQKGKRVGIVMFDFFDQPGDLMDTFLSL